MTFRSLILTAAGAATFGSATAALAQIDPDDTGLGTKLGMRELNNSGEVGTVTLFGRSGRTTLVVLHLASEPPGRAQPARINRGPSCSTLDPKPAYELAPAINGLSRTLVHAPAGKLLSGNYVVDVRAAHDRMGLAVSCGELYR
jgi:hypothetical protein